MPAPMKVVVYLRCSTAEQANEGLSLHAQLDKIRSYAEVYGLETVEITKDPGVSAKSYGSLRQTLLHRPGLLNAIGVLEAGLADGLLIMKLDRLSRSVRDLDELVQRYFVDRFALLSVSDQIDTRTAAGRMVINIVMSVAQGERETIGERTAAALAHKRNQGEYCGGEPPYGWKVADDGVHLAPHNGEQHAIRIALGLRNFGLSLRDIGSSLEGEGIYPRNGRRWHPSTVKSLLNGRLASDAEVTA